MATIRFRETLLCNRFRLCLPQRASFPVIPQHRKYRLLRQFFGLCAQVSFHGLLESFSTTVTLRSSTARMVKQNMENNTSKLCQQEESVTSDAESDVRWTSVDESLANVIL
ncbi:hypothetical protein E2542_SST07102 [Spatholobus suberectus]|nr:hypothetical protein E2542_SST07102 [Spatholobus suberectus]